MITIYVKTINLSYTFPHLINVFPENNKYDFQLCDSYIKFLTK